MNLLVTALSEAVPVMSVVRVTCTCMSEVVSVKSVMTVLSGVVSEMSVVTVLSGVT